MLKINALNRESSSDEEVPTIRKEAQEEIALELYNNALRLQSLDKHLEAQEILLGLLADNIPLLENNGGLPSSMSTLKYSCFVNIGNIYMKNSDNSKGLEYYLKASDLDATDVTLWHKIGKLALKENRFKQAAYAFAKGLECSESHWPCLDQLVSLLYALRDTISCLEFIGKALCLDPYYTKGLVLRKQIYKDNPAALPYYQKYNPDYIWEPPLDVSIDESDEKKILANEQLLLDKITEVEKSLGPKSLQTIPLPFALDNYTWLSLAKVVIGLHQYISDNHMSHFTMVDLNKCMSQIVNNDDKTETKNDVEMSEVEPVKVDEVPEKEEEIVEQKPESDVDEEKEKDKIEVESVGERRPSQNSETNNEGQENTPNQTDNDEEQPMEQDGDDQEDNNDSKSEKRSLNKSNKRKRDLLSDLQIWGWHSKRKSSKKSKSDRDITNIEEALNKIIPKSLLSTEIVNEKVNQGEDSVNIIDMYNMHIENENEPTPSSAETETYFGTDKEKEDILALWLKPRDYCDAVVLIRDFVIALSKLWNIKWPKELVEMYIDGYCMYREHFEHAPFFSREAAFTEMRDDALATLLYGEFINFSSPKTETRTIHVTSLAFLQAVSSWEEDWKDEFASINLRVFWLRAHIFRKEGHNDLGIRVFELIEEIIMEEEKKSPLNFTLHLPNCFKNSDINTLVVSKFLKHLDMITSLNCLEDLFNKENYREVAAILKLTFSNLGNYPTCGKLGRPAQLAMLLHCLWYTDLIECFIWTEECLFEALTHFLKPAGDADKWEKLLEKCLAFLKEIIQMETVSVVDVLNEERRARLVDTLSKIVHKQVNTEVSRIPLGCITPWILLHFVLVREEHRQQANKKVSHIKTDKVENQSDNSDNSSEELPPSVAILFTAHEFLGPKGWCLTNTGELLHFILDTILDRLDTPIFELLREKIDIHIEQALFCLYQHPSKKNKVSRHLADHNVDPLSLTWDRAFQLYNFYGPDSLPEFNSYKNASISSDTEQLLQRILALVPSEMDPQPHMSKIADYVHGRTTELPEPINFSNKVRAIYYLIGDFYFKQREFNRCIKYFMMDLCINPDRLDSWTCIALSYLSQLENKLNYCKKLKSEMDFLDKAKSAQICFKKALDLDMEHMILWIEYGSFEYMVHSFCSRVLKTESDTLSMERFEYLENQKDYYLDGSGRSFDKAIELYQPDEIDADERWLQYYILGKISEKKQQEPQQYLKYYIMASKLLHENNAMYPDKINYYNPQHLSVEALELHYRINASILKYLELHEGKEIPNALGNIFKEHLEKSYFPKKNIVKENPPPVQSNLETSVTSTSLTSTNTAITVTSSIPSTISTTTTSSVSTATPFVPIVSKPVKETPDTPIAKTIDYDKEVKNCLDDIINTVVRKLKMKDQEKSRQTADVIMISDSEDEQAMDCDSVVDLSDKTGGNDVQEVLDKMMQETMQKTEEHISDSDTSMTSKNVSEVRIEDATSKGTEEEKIKSTRETDVRTSIDESSTTRSSSSSSSSSSSDSDSDDDSSSTSSSSSSENNNGNMSTGEIAALVDRCINGLEQCVIRLPQNYKALYRLAHLYLNYKNKKDLNKSKQLLLGEYTCKGGVVITGLFSDRKNQNFFNGIWRIPSSEIDRPGSLSAHMSRCVALLLQILRATNDNKLLLDLSMQFRKAPDPDKIYIKDSERLQFADQAMAMCVQSLRAQIQNVETMTEAAVHRLLQDIFRSYQRIQKNETSKESTFASMLMEVYKRFKKGKIPENANVLDLATKFCQQNRIAEKQKRQQQQQLQTQQTQLRSPGVSNPPVLPTPPTANPTNTQPPLKRPGMGRPRGRPPLPKVPGQVRSPRGRSPNISSNAYSWQKSIMEQNATYNYLKHYQDELIKQYSQSLSLSQLTQLSQYYSQTQFANALSQAQLLNNPSSLLSSSNLLKQMSSSQFLTPQLGESSKSGYHKKTDLPNLSMDALKAFATSNMETNKKTVSQSNSLAMSSTSSKPKPSTLSNPYNVMPAHQSTLIGSKSSPKSFVSKADIIKHSVTSMSQVPVTCKTKSVYTGSAFKSTYTGNIGYGAAEITKVGKPIAATKTTASSQIFKEPVITKPLHHKTMDKTANILMKERPNISITPVMQGPPSLITTSSFATPTPVPSTGKTLQEKLADKQKQHSAKQLGRNIEAEIITTPAGIKKSLNIPSIPSALSVSKRPPFQFPIDSGISISQIPVTRPNKTKDAINLQRKDPVPKSSKQEITLPPNLPLSLSVNKRLERKPSDDDVIIIE